MQPTLYAVMKFRPLHESPVDREKVSKIISLVNKMFQPYLASPFLLSGAEIEGVLFVQEAPRFLHLMQLVDLEMHPLLSIRPWRRCHRHRVENPPVRGRRCRGCRNKGAGGHRRQKKPSRTWPEDRDVAVRLPSPFLTRLTNTLFVIESDLRNDWSAAHRETIKLARQGRPRSKWRDPRHHPGGGEPEVGYARWDRYGEICRMLWELLSQARWRTLLPWDLQKTLGKPE